LLGFGEDFGGEEQDLSLGVFPGVGFEAGLRGAAMAEEFLFGPTEFASDLGQEAAGVESSADVYAVLAELEGEGVASFL